MRGVLGNGCLDWRTVLTGLRFILSIVIVVIAIFVVLESLTSNVLTIFRLNSFFFVALSLVVLRFRFLSLLPPLRFLPACPGHNLPRNIR